MRISDWSSDVCSSDLSTTMYASASIFSMVGSTVGGAIGRRIRRDCPVGDGWKLSRTPGSGASPDKTSQSCADGGMARFIGRRSARGDRNNAMRPCFSAPVVAPCPFLHQYRNLLLAPLCRALAMPTQEIVRTSVRDRVCQSLY